MVRRNKTSKPRFNWEGDGQDYYVDGDGYTHDKTSSRTSENDDEHTISIQDVPPPSDSREEGTYTPREDEQLDASADVLELPLSDELAIVSNSTLLKTDETNVMLFNTEFHAEEKESTQEDDWDVLTAIETLGINLSPDLTNEDDWDALSDVNSVMSVDTFSSVHRLSYKEMVTKSPVNDHRFNQNQNLSPENHNSQKDRKKDSDSSSTTAMLPIDENDCCDIFMEYEGYKYSRGGKDALKFRGLDRHQRGRTSAFKYHAKSYRKDSLNRNNTY